jgi:hypothetical protein
MVGMEASVHFLMNECILAFNDNQTLQAKFVAVVAVVAVVSLVSNAIGEFEKNRDRASAFIRVHQGSSAFIGGAPRAGLHPGGASSPYRT